MLGALPTVVLFTITYIAYRVLVHKPLVRVLADRRARTQGAVEKAQQDIAAAERKTAEYEAQLREARMKIFQQQEQRRRQWSDERTALVHQARQEAEGRIKVARGSLDQDVEAAKSEIQQSAQTLSEQVVRSVLKTQRQPVGVER
ncbi:MAG TPA: ATP synthase F0 subunit B [Terriglobales bacterium]|jgi:F-type H+-transporting ATPase subunit b